MNDAIMAAYLLGFVSRENKVASFCDVFFFVAALPSTEEEKHNLVKQM